MNHSYTGQSVNRGSLKIPVYLQLLIVAQAFTAFLTETKFLPLKHNVGPFEVASIVTSIAVLVYFSGSKSRIRFHRVLLPLSLMVVAAGLSNYRIMTDPDLYITFRVLSLGILILSTFLLIVWYNLFMLNEKSLSLFLSAITYSAAFIAVWVLLDQLGSGGAASSAGPFRNRAHAGIYMHTAFWLVLLRANWPRGNRFERFLTYPVMIMILYVIAGAGRRSVYIALGFGLVLLSLGMFSVAPIARKRIGLVLVVFVGAVGFMYFKASEFWKPAAFFKDRVEMVDDRISTFSGLSGEETDKSFVLSQREAGFRAFWESPILGIGYGGFAKYEGNPTKHEMHSTPQRFLAELGAVGIVLYLWFMLEIALAAGRAWIRNRHGPYGAPSLILVVSVLCMSLSYVYNRQMTDRTFWLLLVLVIVMDTLARERTVIPKASRSKRTYGRAPLRTRPVRPYSVRRP